MSNALTHLEVRMAHGDDCAVIVDFNIAMAMETEQKRLERWTVNAGVESLIARPEYGFYLVAQLGSEVIAALMITYEWSDWRNGLFWWIQSVYVRPEYRRQGMFRRMYEHVQREARQRPQVCGLRLYVERDNLTAQATYRSLGMQPAGYDVYELEF